VTTSPVEAIEAFIASVSPVTSFAPKSRTRIATSPSERFTAAPSFDPFDDFVADQRREPFPAFEVQLVQLGRERVKDRKVVRPASVEVGLPEPGLREDGSDADLRRVLAKVG
jgi:hypothetical protein